MKRTKFNTSKKIEPGSRVLFQNRKATVWEIAGSSKNRRIFIKFDDAKHQASSVQETDLKLIKQ